MKPLYERVLVKPKDKETRTKQGIMLPEKAVKKPNIGVVINCGDGTKNNENYENFEIFCIFFFINLQPFCIYNVGSKSWKLGCWNCLCLCECLGVIMYKEIILDLSTGEEIEREYTAEEIAEVEKFQAQAEALAIKQAEKETARKAIFEKLGITEDEAKLLLS